MDEAPSPNATPPEEFQQEETVLLLVFSAKNTAAHSNALYFTTHDALLISRDVQSVSNTK